MNTDACESTGSDLSWCDVHDSRWSWNDDKCYKKADERFLEISQEFKCNFCDRIWTMVVGEVLFCREHYLEYGDKV